MVWDFRNPDVVLAIKDRIFLPGTFINGTAAAGVSRSTVLSKIPCQFKGQ
jgi:hypothetical protein